MSALHDQAARLRDVAANLQTFADGDNTPIEHALQVAQRSQTRLGLSPEHTVVALAGATGSGKSSLLNALAGTEIARSGVRRPTTSEPLACVWGDGAGDLLAELGIHDIHRLASGALDGLVVIDLPDIDSVSTSHRDTARTLYVQSDLVLWVLDPQKYADSSIHNEHLVPMAAMAESMFVVLNKVDTLSAADQSAVEHSLADLLHSEGLGTLPILGISATTEEGILDLRAILADAVSSKLAAEQRIRSDIRHAARGLIPLVGYESPSGIDDLAAKRLTDTVSVAVGAEIVADASAAEYRQRARATAGFPLTKWVAKIPMSPLQRIGLGSDAPAELQRTSLPARSVSSEAVLRRGVRAYATGVTEKLPRGFRDVLHERITDLALHNDDLFDAAVVQTKLPSADRSWWPIVGVLHWIFIAATVIGLGFLAAKTWLDWFATSAFGNDVVGPLPWAGICVIIGVVGSLVLSAVVNAAVGVGAARQRRVAWQRLRAQIAEVLRQQVLDPTSQVLMTHAEAQRQVSDLAELPS